MSTIGRGTTPYLQIAIKGYDISDAAVVYVTIEQGTLVEFNLTDDRIHVAYENDVSVVTAHLTQEETLQFKKGYAEVQVRWRDQSGNAFSTETMTINIYKALFEEVI